MHRIVALVCANFGTYGSNTLLVAEEFLAFLNYEEPTVKPFSGGPHIPFPGNPPSRVLP